MHEYSSENDMMARIQISLENNNLWEYLLRNDANGFGCHLKGFKSEVKTKKKTLKLSRTFDYNCSD